MNRTLNIRAAGSGDAPFAASMICLSLHELADHLFQLNTDAIKVATAELFARNAGRFGYEHAYVAECDGEAVGLLVAYRGDRVSRLNLETVPHLIAVLGLVNAIRFVYRGVTLPGGKEAENDEFFISNVGILPSLQGRSLGSQLLAFAEELACENNLKKCSLIVSWRNTDAKRLYERIGYKIAEAVQDDEKDLGYYRMVKVL